MGKDCNKLRIRKMEKLPYIPTSQQTIGTVEHGVLLRRPTTPMSPPLVLQKGTSRPHFHLPHKSIMLCSSFSFRHPNDDGDSSFLIWLHPKIK
ncbi:hypothetical protein PGT21_015624 [Puccinia graminis f. sp. tritici]|uniref:Uncharacterized protein n=1 Tax=Puccinia graminis f. sp. tritici TaxID=56615 RepID=A0A5B0NIK8_PUCGR|nr:hypothetical protein PGT21_015624 [Puccinia graminis f. sp. tritici]KAA1087960.1 hypothetical protein PGTUg99_010144 [Puccinia graminis f. sp. tritici]